MGGKRKCERGRGKEREKGKREKAGQERTSL
jgi:hypothetical protein